ARVSAVIIRCSGRAVRVVHSCIRVDAAGPKFLEPVMLIRRLDPYGWSCLEMGTRERRWLCINSKSRGILDVTRDSVTRGDRKNDIVLPKRFHPCGHVYAPSEYRIRYPVGEKGAD